MIDTKMPGSPGWWLQRLHRKLMERQPRYNLLDSYLCGTAGIPVHAGKKMRESYARLMTLARTNYSELVVEATRERMRPQAFRTGADGDENGDAEALRIWQANSLDADSALVHRLSLGLGDAYVIVGLVDSEIGAPLITVEDPRQVIVEVDPRYRRRVVAALKIFRDDIAGVDRAYLYLPGRVLKAAATTSQSALDQPDLDLSTWSWDGAEQKLPAPIVPVVPFPNQANVFGRSYGEFERHLGLVDRINYGVLSRLEVMTLQAFRQRAITGLPDRDEDGNDIDYSDVFSLDPGSLWQLPEGSEMWESNQVDLTPIKQAVRDDIQDFAAVTRTPLHYLTPDAASQSAEGAALSREGLVFKCEDRMVQAGESWETVMSMAFLFSGDTERAARRDLEVVWASAERFSLAERYDAATKASSAGVPWHQVMSDVLQFSPQQINRMQSERAADALLTASLQQPAAQAPGLSPADVRSRADAMGVLIRAGVSPESAAEQVGLTGLVFTGAVPTSLRLPEVDAQALEP